jgi:hypothetical protein
MQVVRDYAASGKRLGQAGPFGVGRESRRSSGGGIGVGSEEIWTTKSRQPAAPVSPQQVYYIVEYEDVWKNIEIFPHIYISKKVIVSSISWKYILPPGTIVKNESCSG